MRIGRGLALGVLLLGLGLAGCGGQGKDSSVAPSGLSDQERALKFAQCMRQHGVDMPDPQGDGDGHAIENPRDADPKKVAAATQQCRQFAPNGGEPPRMDPEQVEQMRIFAKCMRDHGVPNFPDPSDDGTVAITPGTSSPGDLGLDPSDPKFQAAQQACEKFQPKAPGGGNR